jgi:hypothetical protein
MKRAEAEFTKKAWQGMPESFISGGSLTNLVCREYQKPVLAIHRGSASDCQAGIIFIHRIL